MRLIILTTIAFLASFQYTFSQDIQSEVYKGKMDGKTPLTLYVQSYENECTTDIMYDGMYKYNGKSEWLQLNITSNYNSQFVLVEYGFTGVLILKKGANGFDGIWISPDSKKQLPVNFQKVEIPSDKMETIQNEFEEVNYVNHDC